MDQINRASFVLRLRAIDCSERFALFGQDLAEFIESLFAKFIFNLRVCEFGLRSNRRKQIESFPSQRQTTSSLVLTIVCSFNKFAALDVDGTEVANIDYD